LQRTHLEVSFDSQRVRAALPDLIYLGGLELFHSASVRLFFQCVERVWSLRADVCVGWECWRRS
jgi:hypothetical protein